MKILLRMFVFICNFLKKSYPPKDRYANLAEYTIILLFIAIQGKDRRTIMGNQSVWEDQLYREGFRAQDQIDKEDKLKAESIANHQEQDERVFSVNALCRENLFGKPTDKNMNHTVNSVSSTDPLCNAISDTKMLFYIFVIIPIFLSFFILLTGAIPLIELLFLVAVPGVILNYKRKPFTHMADNSMVAGYGQIAIYKNFYFCSYW